MERISLSLINCDVTIFIHCSQLIIIIIIGWSGRFIAKRPSSSGSRCHLGCSHYLFPLCTLNNFGETKVHADRYKNIFDEIFFSPATCNIFPSIQTKVEKSKLTIRSSLHPKIVNDAAGNREAMTRDTKKHQRFKIHVVFFQLNNLVRWYFYTDTASCIIGCQDIIYTFLAKLPCVTINVSTTSTALELECLWNVNWNYLVRGNNWNV